ncbi:MAG TPA: hypothetical protein VHJ77_08325 [Vicinamibacterales bacterium]|jgi:hypothetical protein|nr:hypothetical protein [Vicinamibacterales bacterium]
MFLIALGFAFITFAVTLGAAVLGIALRRMLPQEHLNRESQDVIRLGMGLVATMTALLLGLVTATAKGSFDSQDVAVRNAAAGILSLDRLLARYGPETQPARAMLKRAVADRIESIWSNSGTVSAQSAPALASQQNPPPAEEVENMILRLQPGTTSQRWMQTEALKLTEEVMRARWRVLGSSGGSVPRMFLVVVIFWLAMTFGSFGLSAPRNATVVTVFGIASLSVAAAVFLILELDSPLDGIVKISSGPLRYALENLGR